MKLVILTVSIFALSAATASACDLQRSAQAADEAANQTVVASITATEGAPQQSTPVAPQASAPTSQTSIPLQKH
ncbi:hypothetical protein E0668_23965 [Salmonella enterica subsp. enterica]|nr:hypothetical protein [Salmonella enterica subsp. enterica]ECI7685930.1 hypothetical protein [Salmonella enterica subsp. enterica serovar Paratyphi A]